jgi:hypothetical protein
MRIGDNILCGFNIFEARTRDQCGLHIRRIALEIFFPVGISTSGEQPERIQSLTDD